MAEPAATARVSSATLPDPMAVGPTDTPTPTLAPALELHSKPILYYTQAADTLPVVAQRFGVEPSEIQSTDPIPDSAYLTPGQLLLIPQRLGSTTSSQRLIPDSEVIFSPSATNFDISSFVKNAGGRLGTQREWLKSAGIISGAELIQRVATDNSMNPRLLLSLLEYESGWVFGKPASQEEVDYPLSFKNPGKKGLYNQLMWAVDQLSIGYYAYREGRLTEIRLPDGSIARLAPDLNAGTVALQYFFAQLYQGQEWLDVLDPETGFPALHTRIFGDPWQRAQLVEPLFPTGIEQVPLNLPFERNQTWSFTGGPHGAWDADGPYAALDFAPGSNSPGCQKSNAWVLAAATGLVIRSGNGVVVLDIDGDGRQETGWVLVYTHVASENAIPVGSWVDRGNRLGNPSCEGGIATGTHVHIARKFNGEWIPAYGPLPFNLGGWIAGYGGAAYKGTLTRDGVVVKACTCSNAQTFITRTENDP
jgi:LasA protease